MTSMKIFAAGALLVTAHAVSAQSPTPPAAQPATTLQSPAVAPPPPRPAATVPAAQRTPTAPVNLRPAPASLPSPATVHPDSLRRRAAAAATSNAPAAPALRVAAPPRKAPTAAQSAIAKSVAPAASRPVGATMHCKDGTYLTGAPAADRCAANGGVAAIFPASPGVAAPRPQPQGQRKQP